MFWIGIIVGLVIGCLAGVAVAVGFVVWRAVAAYSRG